LSSLTLDQVVTDPATAVSVLFESAARNLWAERILYLEIGLAVAFALAFDIYRRRDLRQRYLSRSVRVDMTYAAVEFTHLLQLAVIGMLPAVIAHFLRTHAPWLGFLPVDWMPLWCRWIVVFVVLDFVVYWQHRAQHASRFFWQLHKTHHSQVELTVFTVFRLPLIDRTVQTTVLAVASVMMGDDYAIPSSIAMILLLHQLIEHSDTGLSFGPLDRLFVSPRYHQVHHSTRADHLDRNFAGVFSIWDRMFGTYAEHGPGPLSYGLVDEELPESYFRQQFVPLTGLWRQARIALVARSAGRTSSQTRLRAEGFEAG
jgi:sterol desaturase/sphingolipid hydroxylase (fatty acid hydroxylase superfamily)